MPATAPLVRDVMSTPVRCLSEASSVREAARFFLGAGHSGAPVVNANGLPTGVVSLKDLLRFALSPELREEWKNAEEPRGFGGTLGDVPVREVMTPRVITIEPHAGREEAIQLMRRHHVRRVFVQDEAGRLIGILSASDLAFGTGA